MGSTTVSPVSPYRPKFWLSFARLSQIAIICLTIGLFIVSIPFNIEHRSTICTNLPCPPGVLTPSSVAAIGQVGLSVNAFVTVTIALDILVAIIYTASAVVIFIRKPDDLHAIFVTVTLVTFGVGTFTGEITGLGNAIPALHGLTETIEFIGNCAIIAFLFTFPSGRFVPRWTGLLCAGWALFQFPRYYFPESRLNLLASSPEAYNLLFVAGIIVSLATQIYRYRRVSGLVARQQTKWIVYGLTIGVGGYLAVRVSSFALADPLGRDLLISLGLAVLAVIFMLLLPVSIAIAVIRYRLWDINPIINRTLVYGALSASTMALYILAVGIFSSFFQNTRMNTAIAFLVTGLIAVLFEPLRARLQRGVNRLMYGERDDPATILARLSQQIETVLAPDSVLPLIVETLAQALRLPFAAILLNNRKGEPQVVAAFGQPAAEIIPYPLHYQSEQIGELRLSPRSPGESFTSADLKLLNIIVQQAGAAAHTARLTVELQQLSTDLQRSREQLVTAQEEERRRLRRDLHDGVGPTLASLAQRLDTAADLVISEPRASVEQLKELKVQVRQTIGEIRRLVYALRPPVLDEFGLVSAIREHIAPYCGPGGLQVSFDVPEALPALPAAVEVAAYRIALEAFTNIVRHAQASVCQIRLWVAGQALWLEISDDGLGLPADIQPGVGLSSMRERAAELGGECRIEPLPGGGTRVGARLPVTKG
jgi:signal transduction histidine kinase